MQGRLVQQESARLADALHDTPNLRLAARPGLPPIDARAPALPVALTALAGSDAELPALPWLLRGWQNGCSAPLGIVLTDAIGTGTLRNGSQV